MASEKQMVANKKNAQKGGRKPGVKTYATLQKEAVLKQFRNEVMGITHVLFKEQLHLATGRSYLFKIDKKAVKTTVGKKTIVKYINKPPKRVTAEGEILDYLKGMVKRGDHEDDSDPDSAYYFITTKDADNKAIDSLLDRTFGKSVQQVSIEDATSTNEETKEKIKQARSQIVD